MGLKSNFRNYIKKIYFKLNPQYKYILWTYDRMNDLYGRVWDELPNRIVGRIPVKSSEGMEQDKLFLCSDVLMYRYLYLLRYIKENDRVLDVESEYGTGMNLLYRYTPIDQGLCLNSIDYYTRLGSMYYSTDSVKYQTGTIYDVNERFDIITMMIERRTCRLVEKDWLRLYELLEYGGILAVALENETVCQKSLEDFFRGFRFTVEKMLYQTKDIPELCEKKPEGPTMVLYLRKLDERHSI